MIYGKTSNRILSTCHKDIQRVFKRLIEITNVDISITRGIATQQEQHNLWKLGRSKPGVKVTNCDGILKLSYHQEKKKGEGAMAVDICIYSQNSRVKPYDELHLTYIAGLVDAIAKDMLENGEITHRIVWGGNWDSDEIIQYDQDLQDKCHWEARDVI